MSWVGELRLLGHVLRRRCRDDGQAHDEFAAQTRTTALDRHRPSVELRQLFHQCQPEADTRLAEAEFRFPSSGERLEDFRGILWQNALTVVPTADDHLRGFAIS